MAVESATYVGQLNSSFPAGGEPVSQGDDHLRLIKATLLATFPGLTSSWLVAGDARWMGKTGDQTITGKLTSAGYLTSIAQGTEVNALTRKDYVDTALAGKQASLGYTPVNTAGDTMTGMLTVPKLNGANTLIFAEQNVERYGILGNTFYSVGFTVGAYKTGTWFNSDGQMNLGKPAGTGLGSGYLLFGLGDATTGSITLATASSVSYNTSSDYRLKENPLPLGDSGEFIDALMPKTWTWKSDGSRGVGFLAHEVQAVSPSSVTGEKDAINEDGTPLMQQMEYGSAEFIANIVAELQSLRRRVAELEAFQ